ncbi:hypothetical protein CCU68_15990 [Pseudomonas gingeri NCPPB 3146 = LMG 5327]|uniref:Diguanylate cyclase n=1 Tax=Pseudomonas gingeri NCPPB 3146 = LMG 5327 TaxID=707248 RepID=A0ABX4Y2M7_9PSED|nr:hypothetical protein CCU68_15990 [Pseudomonas gingeri NCPPB 3146 = LMG 5327]
MRAGHDGCGHNGLRSRGKRADLTGFAQAVKGPTFAVTFSAITALRRTSFRIETCYELDCYCVFP